jgi:creatinine amidohydrolase/Fe(II)-dependent formamide hydrolase-like protein
MARRKGGTVEKDPLAVLEVIDRLEVGPVRVEPRRIVAPYRITQGGREESIDLIFRYEERVFDPSEAASQNLAAMIAAQVALNYGLFAREMVIHGPLDRHDRSLLEHMAEATAQEIYVVKFLMDNPFLVEPARDLPVSRRDSFMRAEMSFPEQVNSIEGEPWETSPDGYVVLSSGGKDSLLSYGLLREIGGTVHPVFVNESGRHWYTALNAYRHFKENVPETARVWTNADRVFTWMLRHLPFVRQDFADVRADEYPIRLWTVAVFVFGALPLARLRGAGMVVVGDEHDTTVRSRYEGITHYSGLYDQGRHFDEALSRYYRKKDWGLVQFSVLRPLSEMLIEKVLVERYIDLQRHQVSCHAAHIEGDRVRPCGLCEKCRRIVGMLVAQGADPGPVGYTPAQVERCMTDLAKKGVHQELPGAEHLAYVLVSIGLLGGHRLGPVAPRRRPEVMSLRFHGERSPINAVPLSIRRPLLEIMLSHSQGSVRPRGRSWEPFDVLTDPLMAAPYPFEAPEGRKKVPDQVVDGSRSHILGELTWPMARQRLTEVDVALLPVGAIEQHGPHLPLDTDAFDAEYLAREVAAACSDPRPLVLPLIPYGVSYHHEDFDGTISINPDTLSRLVYDVGMNMARQGVKKLVIVNGHGGNAPALKFAAQNINRDAHIFTAVETGESSDADVAAITETRGDVHSGEIETSTALATRPHLVRMDRAEAYVPKFSNQYLDFSSKRSVEWYARTARISSSGVMGDPTKASEEKGRRIWEVMVRNMVEFVEALKTMTLEEIYQRRY